MTGPGTNTYLLGQRQVAVVDPGPDLPAHMDVILGAARGPIRWIIVTHTHPDHSPLAARLAARTGARLLGLAPPGDGRQDESFHPDWAPRDGERLELGDETLTAIHTPGHASNCVCYLLQREQLLFTGDHVLEGVSPVILAPDGDMSAYLASLEKLSGLDFNRIAPGHGGIVQGAKQVLSWLREHRLARERKIVEQLAKGPGTLDELTPLVYADVARDRHPWAKLTLEAHLIKLAREGRAALHEGRWRTAGNPSD
jgi:glyoxylase-like metal-dependent hydrolase (beta-lactamase superfamily II)